MFILFLDSLCKHYQKRKSWHTSKQKLNGKYNQSIKGVMMWGFVQGSMLLFIIICFELNIKTAYFNIFNG